MTYPYNFIGSDMVFPIADTLMEISQIEIICGTDRNDGKHSIVYDSLIVALSFLSDIKKVDLKTRAFVDCMDSNGGEALLIASTYKFNLSRSICMNKEIYENAYSNIKKYIAYNSKMNWDKLACKEGSFQDLFTPTSDVFYLNLMPLNSKHSMCDEGVIVELYFRLCSQCLRGSYAILITSILDLQPINYNAPYMEKVFTSNIYPNTNNEVVCNIFFIATTEETMVHALDEQEEFEFHPPKAAPKQIIGLQAKTKGRRK
jgi:hypothetical protein